MATMKPSRPTWYTDDDDSTWERIKEAFKRDWRQTKHDFGGDEPDLDQHVDDTVSQAAGTAPIPPGNMPTPQDDDSDWDETYSDEDEDAYRYGYSAYRHFGTSGEWDDSTEARLQRDWRDNAEWQRRRRAIRRGWMYADAHRGDDADV